MDAQSVKTVEESAHISGYDGHKRVKGRKRHLLMDTLGLPISLSVTSAGIHDKVGAWRLLAGLKPLVPRLAKIWADGAYYSMIHVVGHALSVVASRLMESTDRPSSLAAALAGIRLPPGVAIRLWAETDFPAIQALSDAEGWPTPRACPAAALVATTETGVIAFVRALTDGEVTLFIAEMLVAPSVARQGAWPLLVGCVSPLPFALAILVAYGIGTSTGAVTYSTVIQGRVPDNVRGRVFATLDVVWATGEIASIGVAGFLADRIGIAAVYIGSGVILTLAGIIGLVRVVPAPTVATPAESPV